MLVMPSMPWVSLKRPWKSSKPPIISRRSSLPRSCPTFAIASPSSGGTRPNVSARSLRANGGKFDLDDETARDACAGVGLAPVAQNDLTHDRESEARAVALLVGRVRARPRAPIEALEQVRQILGRQPGSIVGHPEAVTSRRSRHARDAERDPAGSRDVAQRVAQQVLEHLLHPQTVGADPGFRDRLFPRQPEPRGLEALLIPLCDVAGQRHPVEVLELEG